MAIEEKVIQPESVTSTEQPVAETPSQPQTPNLDTLKKQYEEQIANMQKDFAQKLAEKEEDRLGTKRKLNEVYQKKKRRRTTSFRKPRTIQNFVGRSKENEPRDAAKDKHFAARK